MTWFKNSIKLLILGLAVVSVATTQDTEAKSILDVYNLTWRNCRTSIFTAKNLIYNNIGIFTQNSEDYITNYNTWVNTNTVVNTAFGAYNTSCSYSSSHSFSFLKATKSNDIISIDFYNNAGNLSFSKFGYEHTFRNGDTVNLNNIWFGHGFFVLYNDNLTHTLQVFPQYYLEDKIIFVDPLDSSLSNENLDNFFLIDVINKKAWGMKLLITNIDPIFKGDLSNYNIKEFPFVHSYTLTEQANTTPFPKFSVYMNRSDGIWDVLANDTGFAYVRDLSFEPPIFDSDNINTDINSPTYNTEIINNYNNCVNKGENLRKALQLLTMCKNQDTNIDADNIIIDTGLNYTGTASYCLQLDNYIVNAYNTYSGNWNNGLINENANLQDNSAPFNDLIFSWYYNSIFIDENHNISGLPNGNSWCTALTISQAYDNQKTYIEKVADSLTEFFGSGVAGTYLESLQEHTTFSGLIVSLEEGTNGFFSSYLFEPYQLQFNSGFNAFHTQLGVNSCNDINSSFVNMPFGNTALYIISALLIFILLMFL